VVKFNATIIVRPKNGTKRYLLTKALTLVLS